MPRGVQRTVRELSGNFALSEEWSPCKICHSSQSIVKVQIRGERTVKCIVGLCRLLWAPISCPLILLHFFCFSESVKPFAYSASISIATMWNKDMDMSDSVLKGLDIGRFLTLKCLPQGKPRLFSSRNRSLAFQL